MKTLRIIQWIGRIAGVAALLLGLTYWIFQVNLVSIHMLCGILLTLSLLIIAVVALIRKRAPVLSAVSIIYALIVPVFGVTQFDLLVGNLHWLIRTLHLLVGLGALTLLQLLGTQLLDQKRSMDAATSLQATKRSS